MKYNTNNDEFTTELKKLNQTDLTEQIVILNDLIYYHTKRNTIEDKWFIENYNLELEKRK
jgi:capsule polysaccharide modification protein KpsS